jgi:hypothetical protein
MLVYQRVTSIVLPFLLAARHQGYITQTSIDESVDGARKYLVKISWDGIDVLILAIVLQKNTF